jgi:signal transduction histidine kinase
MKNRLKQLISTYFGPELDLRVQLFNALAVISGVFCLILAVVNIYADHGFGTVLIDIVSALFCFALVVFAKRSGNYRLCHAITIIAVFFILFPFLFFRMGGYHGGMPLFLVFAIVYTAFMLEKNAFLVSAVELAVYAGLYLFTYQNPGAFNILTSEKNYLISNIVNLVVVSAALGVTMYAQARLYREQQRKLDEQNHLLERSSLAKTEFLSNTSHEMRTPLTVISVNVQTVTEILEDMGETLKDAEAAELLQNAQQEIMRLSRMVGGMLTLASMSENTDKQVVDFTTLLRGSAEMFSLHLQKRGNCLTAEIAGGLHVFGNADLLAQVMANLLQNASAYTQQGEVTLRAEKSGHEVLVTVRDTGDGISAELLPHVFDRGVSTGGTGFGLYLCKTVVESHGGRIWIESESGIGTAVSLALPTYEGQFGGERA